MEVRPDESTEYLSTLGLTFCFVFIIALTIWHPFEWCRSMRNIRRAWSLRGYVARWYHQAVIVPCLRVQGHWDVQAYGFTGEQHLWLPLQVSHDEECTTIAGLPHHPAQLHLTSLTVELKGREFVEVTIGYTFTATQAIQF